MPQENGLIVVAEVAIALAGFSSIVIALRGRGDDTTSFAYIRLWRLIETSLATVAFALLPFALHYLATPEPLLWRIASAAFGAYVLFAQLYMFLRWWEQWRSPAIPWGSCPVVSTIGRNPLAGPWWKPLSSLSSQSFRADAQPELLVLASQLRSFDRPGDDYQQTV